MAKHQTVQDLFNVLEELMEAGHGERELRVAYQPNYPLQAHFDGVSVPEDWLPDEDTEPEDIEKRKAMPIFLVCGSSDYDNPYAPRAVFDPENQYR